MLTYSSYAGFHFLMMPRRVETGMESRTGQTQGLLGRTGTDRPFSKRVTGQAELMAVTGECRLLVEYVVRFYYR